MKATLAAAVLFVFTSAISSQEIVRIDSGVGGHIHPALCITKKGTLIAVYCKREYKPHLITRSTDGGKSWSKPALFPHTVDTLVYPGSLTTLSDGRVVHAWNVWFITPDKVKSRYVAFSISSDEGKTWSKAVNLSKSADLKTHSVIRHPILELSPTKWLLPLADRTIVYDAKTGKETPFGDKRNHGLVPIVRTVKETVIKGGPFDVRQKGALISGRGLRSTDGGKTWQTIKPFPNIASQGWRHQMVALKNGMVMASQVVGPGTGGHTFNFIVSRDDGVTWDMKNAIEFYSPGRPIGGRACPKTIEVDAKTLGTIYYDTDAKQPGGSGVFFRTTPMVKLIQK